MDLVLHPLGDPEAVLMAEAGLFSLSFSLRGTEGSLGGRGRGTGLAVPCFRLRGSGWGFLDGGGAVERAPAVETASDVAAAVVVVVVVETPLEGRDVLLSLLMVTNMQSSNANINELICANRTKWKLKALCCSCQPPLSLSTQLPTASKRSLHCDAIPASKYYDLCDEKYALFTLFKSDGDLDQVWPIEL